MTLCHPTVQGLIKRRLLVNYRVAPAVMAAQLPVPFRPQLHCGWAIAGICLIRLAQIRLLGLPAVLGLASENAAHRVAVEWTDAAGATQIGVYVPRRDTDSRLSHLAGGRLFPGQQHMADFVVHDAADQLVLRVTAHDGGMQVRVRGTVSDRLPAESCFSSLAEARHFFLCGGPGYSANASGTCFEGLSLVTAECQATPLAVSEVSSSYFDDAKRFPPGSVTFDHALLMREIPHRWQPLPPLPCG